MEKKDLRCDICNKKVGWARLDMNIENVRCEEHMLCDSPNNLIRKKLNELKKRIEKLEDKQ